MCCDKELNLMARLAPEVSGTEGDHTVHTSIDFFKRLIRYDSIGSLKISRDSQKRGTLRKRTLSVAYYL